MTARRQMIEGAASWCLQLIATVLLLIGFILFILCIFVPVILIETVLAVPTWIFNLIVGRNVLEIYWVKHRLERSEKLRLVAWILG